MIAKDENKAYETDRKANMVAVITDGSAVLGLGNIGPSRRNAGYGRQECALQGVWPT